MKVIDASVALDILSGSERGLGFAKSLIGFELHAPHVIDLEVVETLRRWTSHGRLRPAEAEDALDTFLELPIERHSHVPLLKQAWALRHNLTAYDAAYLALATALGAELVTLDAGLRKMAARRVH